MVTIDPKFRPYEKHVYNIHMTEREISSAAEAYAHAQNIPLGHVRKRENAEVIGAIATIYANRRIADKTPYKVGDTIAYRRGYNRGTKKWPDNVYRVEIARIVKVTPEMVELDNGNRVSKLFILGRLKTRKV